MGRILIRWPGWSSIVFVSTAQFEGRGWDGKEVVFEGLGLIFGVNRPKLDSSMGFRTCRLHIPALDDDHGIPSIQRPLILKV